MGEVSLCDTKFVKKRKKKHTQKNIPSLIDICM